MFGSTGLYTDVDTSACSFTDAQPRYMASVMGDTAHWQLTGVNSIYSASPNSFRVYMWHPVLRGKFMPACLRQGRPSRPQQRQRQCQIPWP